MLRIVEATTEQMPIARELFLEYAGTLEFDLGFQGFDEEIASLPIHYSQPRGGCILLAFVDSQIVGCVALRRFSEGVAEMKRLYVRSRFQGRGFGRALALAVIEKASSLGYRKIRLDTVPSMKAAIQMYGSMGFYEIAPYRENPVPGTSYLQKDLSPASPS